VHCYIPLFPYMHRFVDNYVDALLFKINTLKQTTIYEKLYIPVPELHVR